MKTIYISIPSLDDSELVPTVLDAFESASNPERVFVGVSLFAKDKWRAKDFIKATKKYSKNIRFKHERITSSNSDLVSVGTGRKTAASLYNNEDYFLQVDSHTMFTKNWDTVLIDVHEDAVKVVKNDKVVITAYAGYYAYDENGKRSFCDLKRQTIENAWLHCLYFPENLFYYGAIPRWDLIPPHIMIQLKPGTFVPALKFNANFAFSSGAFAANSGLYEDAEFFEEELLQTLNLIKLGYSLVYPVLENPLIGHLYGKYFRKGYGERLSKGDYLFNKQLFLMDQLSVNNYKSFIRAPENKEAVKIYQEYAKIDLRFGSLKTNFFFPDKFLNSEVTSNVIIK
jgi:hypothetical protein